MENGGKDNDGNSKKRKSIKPKEQNNDEYKSKNKK